MILRSMEASEHSIHWKTSMSSFLGLFGGGGSGPVYEVLPISGDKLLYSNIHKVVPRCDKTNDQLMTEAKDHFEKFNEYQKTQIR